MKLGFFGDGPWAHKALERIVANDELEVAFIVARYQNPDAVLRRWAEELGVPFATHRNVNAEDFVDRVRAWAPDVNVSMSFDQILKRPILDVAEGGFINCHAGGLPFYRGRNVLNWALINGAEKIGVTVHYVDEGIDTGDIILQEFFPVGENDNYATVLVQAAELCASTLAKALGRIARGTVVATQQTDIHPVGMYCSRRREGDEWIDWSWSSKRVHDFVRGIAPPGPGARTVLGDEVISVTETRLIPGAPEYLDRPGTVVGRDNEGVIVKTGDSTVRITGIQRLGETDAAAESQMPTFRIGTQLGMNPWEELVTLRQRVRELKRQAVTSE